MWQYIEAGPTKCHRVLSFPSLNEVRERGYMRRVASLQFISKKFEFGEKVRAYVKIRYKDASKFIIWQECRLEGSEGKGNDHFKVFPHASPVRFPPREPDPRTTLNQAELDDYRSPYLPCTINSVARSDSEDSSSAESVLGMTRL
uniref:Arrestin_N domain-containing protein n=1 Tax=Haemonchus contortus TaxID=6289 RepID=A0A7I4Z2U2_HAECO